MAGARHPQLNEARQLKDRAIKAGMSESEVKSLNIAAKVGRDEDELKAAMEAALPIIEAKEKTLNDTSLDVQADTIREAKLIPQHRDHESMYDVVYASNDLRYLCVNTQAQISKGMNLRGPDFYTRLGYGRVDAVAKDGKMIRLVYREGHPQNLRGGITDVRPNQILMAIPWKQWEANDAQRIEEAGLRPEVEYENDKQISYVGTGKVGTMTVEHDRAYTKAHGRITPDNIGDHLPKAGDRAARSAAVNRGNRRLEEVDRQMENLDGESLSDRIMREVDKRDPLAG